MGVVDHKLHTRNIEDMSGLIRSMPRVAVLMLIGMAGMFLAPFGMLISKWAVLKAVVDAYPALSVFIAFGSAATLFFWVKWMGKLIEVTKPRPCVEKNISCMEWSALYTLSAMTFATCLFFPLLSMAIEPYVVGLFGHTGNIGADNFTIMVIMLLMVCLFPLSFLNYGRKVTVSDAYLGGANVKGDGIQFQGSAGAVQDMGMKNYYFDDFLGEARVFRAGVISGVCMLVVLFALILKSL